MAIRNIRQVGDPILRKTSKEVKEVNDRIKILLEDMAETMYKADGVGLAAPQVGLLKRVIVVDIRDEQGLIKLVNPEIIEKDGEQIGVEGCLSVPGKNGYVERPKTVTVEYTDLDGNIQRKTATDYKAHCFCHELDHLDGVLYTDKVLDLTDEEIESLNNEK